MRIRLKEIRNALGLSLEAMEERAGYSASQLSRWESGRSNVPSERLPELARAYECRIADIFAEDDSPYLPLGPTLYVTGEVAAGVWKHVWEWGRDQWQAFTGQADVTGLQRERFGLRVVGESMNLLYPDGTIVECLSLIGGAEIQSGKRVVVQRQREDGEFELTVKEYVVDDTGRKWLVPRSSHPEFQAPYELESTEPGIVEVKILAVIVASIRPE